MESPFAKFQGGIQANENIASTGRFLGELAYKSFADAGAQMAEGLKAYQKNAAEDDYLTESLSMKATELSKWANVVQQDPKYAPLIEGFLPMMEKAGKGPSMSLNQKRALDSQLGAFLKAVPDDLRTIDTISANQEKRQAVAAKARGVSESLQAIIPTLKLNPNRAHFAAQAERLFSGIQSAQSENELSNAAITAEQFLNALGPAMQIQDAETAAAAKGVLSDPSVLNRVLGGEQVTEPVEIKGVQLVSKTGDLLSPTQAVQEFLSKAKTVGEQSGDMTISPTAISEFLSEAGKQITKANIPNQAKVEWGRAAMDYAARDMLGDAAGDFIFGKKGEDSSIKLTKTSTQNVLAEREKEAQAAREDFGRERTPFTFKVDGVEITDKDGKPRMFKSDLEVLVYLEKKTSGAKKQILDYLHDKASEAGMDDEQTYNYVVTALGSLGLKDKLEGDDKQRFKLLQERADRLIQEKGGPESKNVTGGIAAAGGWTALGLGATSLIDKGYGKLEKQFGLEGFGVGPIGTPAYRARTGEVANRGELIEIKRYLQRRRRAEQAAYEAQAALHAANAEIERQDKGNLAEPPEAPKRPSTDLGAVKERARTEILEAKKAEMGFAGAGNEWLKNKHPKAWKEITAHTEAKLAEALSPKFAARMATRARIKKAGGGIILTGAAMVGLPKLEAKIKEDKVIESIQPYYDILAPESDFQTQYKILDARAKAISARQDNVARDIQLTNATVKAPSISTDSITAGSVSYTKAVERQDAVNKAAQEINARLGFNYADARDVAEKLLPADTSPRVVKIGDMTMVRFIDNGKVEYKPYKPDEESSSGYLGEIVPSETTGPDGKIRYVPKLKPLEFNSLVIGGKMPANALPTEAKEAREFFFNADVAISALLRIDKAITATKDEFRITKRELAAEVDTLARYAGFVSAKGLASPPVSDVELASIQQMTVGDPNSLVQWDDTSIKKIRTMLMLTKEAARSKASSLGLRNNIIFKDDAQMSATEDPVARARQENLENRYPRANK